MTVSVLILGTADWNQPIATNQHYVARELATEHSVRFVESMGLRRPELRRSDIARIAARIRSGSTARADCRPNRGIDVLRPLTIPFHQGPARVVNRAMLERLTSTWKSSAGTKLLWTYTPNTYGLEQHADGTVYHCVDLLGAVRGIDSDLIAKEEVRLARSGVLAVASSSVVYDHLKSVGFANVRLWSNVADTAPIAAAVARAEKRVERAVFAGNLTSSKVDFDLLGDLLDQGVRVDLAGPVSEGGGSAATQVSALEDKGAVYHGHLGYAALSELYASSTVGMIPYLINQYTTGVNPLKTFEYLAAGLKVVSTAIPAVESRPGHVDIARSREQFSGAVAQSIGVPSSSEIAARTEIADHHSWRRRGRQIHELVSELTANHAS